MSEADLLDLLRQALWTALLIGGPAIGAGMAVGLIVAIFQALTQVQESTLTFVPKMAAIILIVLATAGWTGGQLGLFTALVYGRIAGGF